jgi:hypothetical protein
MIMLTELKKDEIYMWLNPTTAHGLKFRVVKILEHSYLLRYLNYPYKIPKSDVVQISFEFMQSRILDVLRVVKV